MDLTQLHAFIHVIKTGNISQCAKELGISQPTLSRHIAHLESTLGQTLINREHRPITPTPAGQFFYDHIQKSMAEIDEIVMLTRNFGKNTPNVLTIGFVASILYGLLPDVIGKLKSKLPKLDVRLIEVSSDEQAHALKVGEIDVGFGRFLVADGFVRQIFLRHEPFVVALPTRHRLAKKSALSFKQLIDETLITYHRTPLNLGGDQTLDPLLQLFYERNLAPTHIKKARDIQIALGLVSAGEGITLVPKSLMSVRAEQIRYLPISPNNATSPIYINTLSSTDNVHLPALLDAVYAVYAQQGIPHEPFLLG